MGQTIEVSIDNQGGILLPQELKNRLGLSPGMTMLVEEDDQKRVFLRVRTWTKRSSIMSCVKSGKTAAVISI